MASIDAMDQQLIRLLTDNARQTSEALAKQLGVNPSTIRRRLQTLVKNKVIRIVALPQPDKIGFAFRAVVAFDVAHEKLDSVIEQLRLRPEVQWLSVTYTAFPDNHLTFADDSHTLWAETLQESIHNEVP